MKRRDALRFRSGPVPARILACLAVALLLSAPAGAQEGARAFLAGPEEPEEADEGVIRLYNEYISILVNTTEENTGRFAVQTTGGDPDRASDDNSPLIYLIPGQKPWTSYATVRIDGIDYVFGGRPTERAGRAGLYGEMLVAPHVVDDRRIETVYRIGPVDVTQVLSIIRSSTTGLLDTVRIEYRLVNTSDQVHHVGLRLMIDTMLGANDGAPLRVGELAITTDTVFEGDAIPEFWQAFDSLSDPKVTAQGTLKGDDVTPPDRVYFSNWGALADGLWEFDFQPGRDFTRLGEFELDSATALYWDPRPLAPGEERVYVTHYGLGGISISPGDLSIGVTSPSTVTADPDRTVTFPVVAYIQNTGEGEARNVVARIQLPQGLRLADGEQAVRQLGNLPTGRSAQVTWRVAVDRAVGGELTYTVRVEAINAEPNQVSRAVRIVSPAALTITLLEPQGRLRMGESGWEPLPYRVTARVQNTGGADANSVIVRWDSPLGLELARGSRAEKLIGPLLEGEAFEVSWYIQPVTRPQPYNGNLPYTVQGQIFGSSQDYRANGFLDVPLFEGEVRAEPVRVDGAAPVRTGDRVLVDIVARNARKFYGAEIVVRYDPTALELIGRAIYPGRLFFEEVRDGEDARVLAWKAPEIQLPVREGAAAEVTLRGERAGARQPELYWATDTIATLSFRVLKPGTHSIELAEVRVYDAAGQVVKVAAAGGRISVGE